MSDHVESNKRRWDAFYEGHWTDGVLLNCPESWDGDEAPEYIALSYVATLEARLDAAGISREKWISDK